MKLTLNNYAPISNNKAQRMHWTKRMKAKEEIFWLIKEAIGGRWHGKPYEEAKVHCDIYLSTNRAYDRDNFWGGSGKWILDLLKHEGIIFDDSHQYVVLSEAFYKDKGNPRIEVIVEKLER